MGIGLFLTGRYGKRGVLARGPAPTAWLQSVEAWLKDYCSDLMLSTGWGKDEEGNPTLHARLHPSAESVDFSAAGGGRVLVSAKTSTTGAGYHVYLCQILRRMGVGLRVAWDDPDEEGDTGDDTGYFHSGDRAAVDREMLTWLQAMARLALESADRDQDSYPAAWCLSLDHQYWADGAVCTPTGPRDRRWLQQVAEDPRQGIDFFSWWHEGQGACYYLGRALCQLWTEVRWRPPLNDEEARLLSNIAHLLETAYRLDPALDYPWHEWHEILEYLGTTGPFAQEVAQRAAPMPVASKIGYRRRNVTSALPGGWSIEIPGSFAEGWDPKGTWEAWDASREVYFTVFSFSADSREPIAPEALLSRSPLPEGEVLKHDQNGVIGRAVLTSATHEGEQYWQLNVRSAVAGSLALGTLCYGNTDDHRWAIDTWHSLSCQSRRA